MTKYKIGDKVWWAHCEFLNVRKQCTICFGKLEVTLILGDGSAVVLPCGYCGNGYQGPRGFIEEHEFVSQPELLTITSMEVTVDGTGETVRYQIGNRCPDNEDLFDTREEAMARCTVKAQKLEEEQRTRAEYIKQDKRKSFAWNAGYHLKEVKEHERQIEYHRKNAKLCKDRVKEDPEKLKLVKMSVAVDTSKPVTTGNPKLDAVLEKGFTPEELTRV